LHVSFGAVRQVWCDALPLPFHRIDAEAGVEFFLEPAAVADGLDGAGMRPVARAKLAIVSVSGQME
jgi:hypothetical protein